MKFPSPCLGLALVLTLGLTGCSTTSVPDVTPTPTPATVTPMPTVKPDDSYEADEHGHVTSPEGDDLLDMAGDAIMDAADNAEDAVERMMR